MRKRLSALTLGAGIGLLAFAPGVAPQAAAQVPPPPAPPSGAITTVPGVQAIAPNGQVKPGN